MPALDVDFRSALRRTRRLLDDAGASLLNRRVLALCSGGVDSVVLVDLLARLPRGAAPKSIRVLCLDHGVRAGVEAELAAARAVAAAHDFDITVERGALDTSTHGTQAAARTWRYATAARVAAVHGCDVVVTGHTASDQLEGALLGLVAVTGSGAPAAMPVARELAPGVQLVRPLLALDRSTILELAAAAGRSWAEDPSNADADAYLRNGVRHRVVPALLDLAPGAGPALARAAQRASTQQLALDSLAAALLDSWGARTAPQRLDVRLAAPLATPARHALLASWLRGAGLGRAVDARAIRAVDELVMRSGDARIDLAGHACVRRDGYDVTLCSTADTGAPRP
ncbi:MAG: tRNA lysidine(34) synthetase TilS [Thermoleophilia bacterium]|nr:tRNA lysidine(34) synthetase TilS [Thermoleophilia bacterium]